MSAFKLHSLRATLHPSRHHGQVLATRDAYLAISNDDILHGFRKEKNLPAPGKVLGGWCSRDSNFVIGQWISGFANLGAALGDARLTQKALDLFEGLVEIFGTGDRHGFDTYGYDKLVGGLVDLHIHTQHPGIIPFLTGLTESAAKTFDRTRPPAGEVDWDGRHPGGSLEWYTLAENLYRAFHHTGNPLFRDFAEVWHYPFFWDKFRDTNRPADAHSVHAYSHVNSFSSLAMAYATDGDPALLRTAVNAHDYMTGTQCYASGAYGAYERLLPVDGRLGYSLDVSCEHGEIGCGSWSAFKLSRYLLEFTGECRFMDWADRVLHNVIGGELPFTSGGLTPYYADYRPSGGARRYFYEPFPCCSGTYIQAVCAYHDLLYFASPEALHTALYLPSCVTDNGLTLTQDADYPARQTIRFTVNLPAPQRRALRFRVPAWCHGAFAETAGTRINGQPGQWLEIDREWHDNDTLELTLPVAPRLESIDAFHPHRCAVMLGPLLLAQCARYAPHLFLREPGDFHRRLRRDEKNPLRYNVVDDFQHDQPTPHFRPYYDYAEGTPIRAYIDTNLPQLYGSWRGR